jgi:hypothetical protein
VIGLAQGAGGGPSTGLTVVGIIALLLAAVFVQRGWDMRVVVVLLVVGVATVVAAFTLYADREEGGDAVAGGASAAQLRAAVVGLCAARAEEDPDVVERIFFDRAHAQMHVLAQELENGHRRRAAELLESMQKVEVGLAGNADTVFPSMDELTRAAATGLTALSIDPPSCAQ